MIYLSLQWQAYKMLFLMEILWLSYDIQNLRSLYKKLC
jgi:hypothetical protein